MGSRDGGQCLEDIVDEAGVRQVVVRSAFKPVSVV